MVREVDLRSDAVTKPTAAMRKAIAEVEVGDDYYGEDLTINKLQEKVAKLLGKEAAIFVTSGTMGNLSSVMSHCWTRGQEVIVGDQSHIFTCEQGGVAQLGGVNVSAIRTLDDGTFDLEELRSKIRPRNPKCHEPATGLICLENTHNRCGGKVLPVAYIRQVCQIAQDHGIPVHMDGARLINASVACGVPVDEIVKDCASVSMCLSKGVGAPVGAIVAGSKEFITRVHRVRKVLGGALGQIGIFAAPALVGIDASEERIRIDHQRSKKFAQDVYNLKSKLIITDPNLVQTNIVLLNFPSADLSSEQFISRMAEVKADDKEKVVVKLCPLLKNRVRCVLHSDLTPEDLDAAIRKIQTIVVKYLNNL